MEELNEKWLNDVTEAVSKRKLLLDEYEKVFVDHVAEKVIAGRALTRKERQRLDAIHGRITPW